MFLLHLNAFSENNVKCSRKDADDDHSSSQKTINLRNQLQTSVEIKSKYLNQVTYLLNGFLQLKEKRSASYHIKLSRALEYEASVYYPVRNELENVQKSKGERSIDDFPNIKLFVEHFNVFTFGLVHKSIAEPSFTRKMKDYFAEFRTSQDFSHYQLFNRRFRDSVRHSYKK